MINKQHKLFWGSSYDRGLDVLLFLWTDIVKEFPDAELHICYGWNLFDVAASSNPERQQWKKKVETMMSQKGIIHHGRIGQKELQEVRSECGIWAYPTYFTEINCITALQAQQDGLVPVTMTLGALSETVGSGVKVEGKITDFEVMETYKKKLLDMMRDTKRWTEESAKAVEFAKNYKWEYMAAKWTDEFTKDISMPLVSIITPTIRQGWWNIMADNLSKQSYKNFEWIIIDDFPEDRSSVAKDYAEKYGLTIRYFRGVKGKNGRQCALVAANNLGISKSSGELLLWLQDFILIPEGGLERIVDIHRHNPDALIAPVDEYYLPSIEPDISSEDWFNGKLDIVGKHHWTNPRVKYEGVRESKNPFEYEANYGAIPAHIAKKVNGFYEFFDDGLGYDNTEFATRALMMGFRLIVDDTNIATCIDHWKPLKGTAQNVLYRERLLNPPRFKWFQNRLQDRTMPVVRDKNLDKTIHLKFSPPKEIDDDHCAEWIENHKLEIVEKWEKES